MQRLPMSKLKSMPAQEIEEAVPLMITVDMADRFVLCKPEDIIYIGDLHPRVKNSFKAIEQKVRVGMPQT